MLNSKLFYTFWLFWMSESTSSFIVVISDHVIHTFHPCHAYAIWFLHCSSTYFTPFIFICWRSNYFYNLPWFVIMTFIVYRYVSRVCVGDENGSTAVVIFCIPGSSPPTTSRNEPATLSFAFSTTCPSDVRFSVNGDDSIRKFRSILINGTSIFHRPLPYS